MSARRPNLVSYVSSNHGYPTPLFCISAGILRLSGKRLVCAGMIRVAGIMRGDPSRRRGPPTPVFSYQGETKDLCAESMYQGETKDLPARSDEEMRIQDSKWEDRWRALAKRKRYEQQECLTHTDTDPERSQLILTLHLPSVTIDCIVTRLESSGGESQNPHPSNPKGAAPGVSPQPRGSRL